MKKIAFFLLVVSFVVLQPPSAFASLIVQNFSGTYVTHDDSTGTYWYWDLNRFTDMNYSEQLAEINSISVSGMPGTWHMATYAQINDLWNNYTPDHIANSFAPTYAYIDSHGFEPNIEWDITVTWLGRADVPSASQPNTHQVWSTTWYSWTNHPYGNMALTTGEIPDVTSQTDLSAWAVFTPVPLPSAIFLLGSGLIGCVGLRRWFRR